MAEQQTRWVKIAAHIDDIAFADNNIASIELDGKPICLGKHDGKLFAFTQKCPHAGAMLSDGFIDALGNVVCPLHRYRFTLKNGYNCSGEGYYMKTWKVEQQEEGVFVEMKNFL
jgi:nitrite reductase/ring-hydroxylating ferredoxin subunit